MSQNSVRALRKDEGDHEEVYINLNDLYMLLIKDQDIISNEHPDISALAYIKDLSDRVYTHGLDVQSMSKKVVLTKKSKNSFRDKGEKL